MAFLFPLRDLLLIIVKRHPLSKQIFILFSCLLLFLVSTQAQPMQVSISTDLGLQRNFKKTQRFWGGGHTVQGQWHFTNRDGAYALIVYFTPGRFRNNVTATAKLPATNPQTLNYVNHATMRFKQMSIGWKHYLKGASNNEENWNLYGCAGFGLLFGQVNNSHTPAPDTSLYDLPVLSGEAHFKRLTFDLCVGWEFNMGGAIFLYNEARIWIPTTNYPSKHIFVNNDAPLAASIHLGVRFLFD
jgi:hypothetical protein